MKDLIENLSLKVDRQSFLYPAKDVVVSIVLNQSFIKRLPCGNCIVDKKPQSVYLNCAIGVYGEFIGYPTFYTEIEFYSFMAKLKNDTLKTICSLKSLA